MTQAPGVAAPGSTLTPIYSTGFESGAFDPGVVHYNFTIGTGQPCNGAHNAHCVVPNGDWGYVYYNPFPGGVTHAVMRVAVYLESLPSGGQAELCDFQGGGSCALIQVSSAGVLSLAMGSGGSPPWPIVATGPTIATGSYHLLEMQLNCGVNPWICDWKVDGALQPQGSYGNALATISISCVGSALFYGAAHVLDVDDWAIGTWANAATDWFGAPA
jgi:hypothetical protein